MVANAGIALLKTIEEGIYGQYIVENYLGGLYL